MAKRILQIVGMVFRYSVAHVSSRRNPAAEIRPSAILKPTRKTNVGRPAERRESALQRNEGASRRLRRMNKNKGKIGCAVQLDRQAMRAHWREIAAARYCTPKLHSPFTSGGQIVVVPPAKPTRIAAMPLDRHKG